MVVQKLILILFLVLASVAFADLPPMPAGFRYPKVERPWMGPYDCASCLDYRQGINTAEYNLLFHRIDPEPIDQKWSGDLLRIETGYPSPWSPEQVYELSLGGVEGFEEFAFVAIARSMVLFEDYDRLDKGATLRSANRPSYTLRRSGKVLVLRQDEGHTWVFASPDFGESWRLSHFGYVGRHRKISIVTEIQQGAAVTYLLKKGYVEKRQKTIAFPSCFG